MAFRKLHYGWVVCGCGTLLTLCCMGLTVNAFSVYLPFIMGRQGLGNAQISVVITVRSLFSLASMFVVTALYNRVGLRVGMALSGLLTAAAFAVCGFADNLAGYCVAGALLGLGYGLGGMVAASMLINRWFSARRGVAMGICASGSGIGAIAGPLLITACVEARGLTFTFLAEAACIAAASLLIFMLVRAKPEDFGLKPYESGSGRGAAGRPAGGCPEPMSRGDWLLFFPALVLIGMSATPATSNFAVHFRGCGFSAMTSAAAVTVFGLVLTGSKFVYGAVADRIGCLRASTLFLAILISGFALICLCWFIPSEPLLYAAAATFGLGCPPTTVGLGIWAADLSVPERYDVTVRRFQTGYFLGGVLGSPIPGLLADRFGNYVPGYALMILFMGYALFALRRMYRRKWRAAKK